MGGTSVQVVAFRALLFAARQIATDHYPGPLIDDRGEIANIIDIN